jgi:hypothetical protein
MPQLPPNNNLLLKDQQKMLINSLRKRGNKKRAIQVNSKMQKIVRNKTKRRVKLNL